MISEQEKSSSHPDTPQILSIDELSRQLATIQRRRRQVNELRQQVCSEKKQALQEQLNYASFLQEQALLDYQSALYRNQKHKNLCQLARQWSSWTDSFHISHRGAFGTINGLRLGAEALALQNPSTEEGFEDRTTTHSPSNNTAPTPLPRLPFSFLLPDNPNNNSNNNNNGSNSGHNSAATTSATPSARPMIKVPWVEINGALGHVALLLVTMQERLQSIDATFCFRHVIKPQGSTSQIGILRRTANSSSRDTNQAVVSAWYPLYSDDTSFPFVLMGKRNFQTALQCLVECVVDAAQAIEKYDRTIVLPYPMEQRQHHPWTVGGSSIQYNFNSGEQHHHNDAMEWTRSMKYLLTNLKQMMTFRAFHLYSDS